MRLTVLMFLAAATLTPEASSAQLRQFEGRVAGTISAEGMTVEIEQLMKGSKMRLDLTLPDREQSVSQILDVTSGQRIMLLHEEEMWADLSVMSRFIPGFAAPTASPADVQLPEFEVTDSLETIAGVECRHYILHIDGGDDVNVCAASGMGCFIPGAPAGLNAGEGGALATLPQSADVWLEEFGDGFFILSMEGGGASYRATEFEEGSPPDEAFAPPSNYTEMQIPGF